MLKHFAGKVMQDSHENGMLLLTVKFVMDGYHLGTYWLEFRFQK